MGEGWWDCIRATKWRSSPEAGQQAVLRLQQLVGQSYSNTLCSNGVTNMVQPGGWAVGHNGGIVRAALDQQLCCRSSIIRQGKEAA